SMSRRCFFIVPVRYCEYFATNEQCKFCNFNTTQEDAKFVGINRQVTINLEDTVEAYKMCGADVPMIEGKLEMGGFMNSETEGRIFFDFIDKLANALPYKPSFGLITEAMSRKDYQRLKDAGLDVTSLQLEVWDPEQFSEIVPGKAKHCSRERWLEAFQDAVDVFGVGHVSGKIIGGLTMIPEKGHKTWQDARDSHIEGNAWMIEHGVFPTFTNLRLPPGAVYAEDPGNRAKLPPTEYYLEVAKAHDEAMKRTGLYDKMSKFLYCGLCCTAAPYVGDIGVIERSGDVGNYMADVVEEDGNWMAKFLNSINAPATAQ
ncbi:MAG: hypothetical protein Q7O66_23590, partial [Dehalococcoidia bacterium]|nr:hypothetical protein [Dehalococcoidia bacterium]